MRTKRRCYLRRGGRVAKRAVGFRFRVLAAAQEVDALWKPALDGLPVDQKVAIEALVMCEDVEEMEDTLTRLGDGDGRGDRSHGTASPGSLRDCSTR